MAQSEQPADPNETGSSCTASRTNGPSIAFIWFGVTQALKDESGDGGPSSRSIDCETKLMYSPGRRHHNGNGDQPAIRIEWLAHSK